MERPNLSRRALSITPVTVNTPQVPELMHMDKRLKAESKAFKSLVNNNTFMQRAQSH